MKKLLIILFPVLLTLVGCAAWQVKKAKERIATSCESLMGHSEEDVIIKLGAPQEIKKVGDLTIYHYYKSYGTCTTTNLNGDYFVTANTSTWESYDKFEIVFKNGHALSWKSSVQR